MRYTNSPSRAEILQRTEPPHSGQPNSKMLQNDPSVLVRSAGQWSASRPSAVCSDGIHARLAGRMFRRSSPASVWIRLCCQKFSKQQVATGSTALGIISLWPSGFSFVPWPTHLDEAPFVLHVESP